MYVHSFRIALSGKAFALHLELTLAWFFILFFFQWSIFKRNTMNTFTIMLHEYHRLHHILHYAAWQHTSGQFKFLTLFTYSTLVNTCHVNINVNQRAYKWYFPYIYCLSSNYAMPNKFLFPCFSIFLLKIILQLSLSFLLLSQSSSRWRFRPYFLLLSWTFSVFVLTFSKFFGYLSLATT